MVVKNKSIQYFIAVQTIPWLVVALIVATTVLLVLGKTIINHQLEEQHLAAADRFQENLEKSIGSLEAQVVNIAQNELIVNSLIDSSGRGNYIASFLQSFGFSNIDQARIEIVDFSGSTIAHNHSVVKNDTASTVEWKNAVLDKGKIISHFNNKGLFFAAPITFANLPEGAVIVSIDLDQLANNFTVALAQGGIVLVDESLIVLFASDGLNVDLSSLFSKKNTEGYVSLSVKYNDNKKIISLIDKQYVNEESSYLLIFLFVAILVAILGIFFSIALSSRLMSKTLSRFVDSIHSIKNKEFDVSRPVQGGLPGELVAIQKQFDDLVVDLLESRLSQKNIQSILNSLNEYLVVFADDGQAKLKNKTFERLVYEIKLHDDEFKKIIPVQYRQHALDPNTPLTDFECFYEIEPILFDQNHSEHCIIRWTRSLFYDDDGSLAGFIFIGTDITRAREIEKDLHIKNQAIEEASNGIVISNALEDGMPVVYVNRAFEKMTGYCKKDIVGNNCRILQGDKTDSKSLGRIRRAIRRNASITETLLNYRKDGTEFFNQLVLNPIHDKKGNVSHYLGVQLDVTDRVQMDQHLMEAKSKAEESAQLKSEFLASMSHEIRTPMNGVLGMLGLVETTEMSQQQSHYVNLAKTSAESLLTLINDILDFSKVEAGKIDLESIDFHLPDMLGDFAEAMAQRAQEKDIELILDITGINHNYVKGDPGRLRQILSNLVGNAIKFTSEGHVLIKVELTKREDDQWELRCMVKDTGIGIPENKIEYLFDAFSQVDASTTREYGGTGLGLAIVKKLCQLMGGDIAVQSGLNSGSAFNFSAYLQKSDKTQLLMPDVDIKGTRILVVDDNPVNQLVLKNQLTSWGASVTVAASGDDALAILEANQANSFAIAILDMQMPGMDGYMLGKTIRQHAHYDKMHLVMMTSLSQRGDAKRFADLGFSAFFPKPATLNDLLGALKVLVDDGEALSQSEPLLTRHHIHSLIDADLPTENNNGQEVGSQQGSEKPNDNQFNTILLVEDNLINQEVALGILDMLGYQADVASDGSQALEMLTNTDNHYGVVLMDCQMPVMDGYEATRQVRAGKAINPNIPIIAMTANAMKGDKEKCLSAGMSDYLSKPIDPLKLKDCLEQWLNAASRKNALSTEERNMSESEFPVWDQEGFMNRVMNNDKIAEKLITLFKTETPKVINELEQAINQEESVEAGVIAHKLKGSVSNLGGIELASLAQKIESAGKESNISEVKALWPHVKPQFDRLVSRIDQG